MSRKYDRNVPILCPTCGGTQFSYSDIEADVPMLTCTSCGRQMPKDDLLRENSESTSLHVEDIKKEFKEDVTKQVRDMLKKTFGKNFRG